MGKLIQKGTQALGLTADPTTGEGAMRQSAALQERVVAELEKLGIPSVEAQRIALEQPELVLSTLEERLGSSAMEDIQSDPRLQEAQTDTLVALQEAGEKGFTEEDRAKIEALRSKINADEQARQASILQGMSQRGALDSGAQLAAQLSSSQNAAQRASEEGVQLSAQQAAARRNALMQAGQMAGQMDVQQFGQRAQRAQAADAIRQFNANVAARDTTARQQHAQQQSNIANQQEMYNKGLIQQQFQNQMAKATGMAGALGNQAQGAMNQAQMQAQAAQQQAAGTRGIALGALQAAVGMKDGGVRRRYEDGGVGMLDPVMGVRGAIVADEQKKLAEQEDDTQSKQKLLDILDRFKNGYNSGVETQQINPVGNINPNQISVPTNVNNQSLNSLQEIKQKLMQGKSFNNGGMNYQAGGEGVVIDSLQDSYAGDELPDRINDGEMVLNLDQQDTINTLLKELGERRRADEKVNNGEAVINEPQQDRLMAVAREEAQPEELLDNGGNIVEDIQSSERQQIGQEEAAPADTNQIEGLLRALQVSEEGHEFADGGLRTPYSTENPIDLNNIVESLANYGQPEPNMSIDDTKPDYSQLMSVGSPAALPEVVENTIEKKEIKQANDIVESPNAPKENENTEDDDLKSARNRDTLVDLLGVVDKSLGHYDAANPNANLKPVQRELMQSNLEDQLLKARQMASNKAKDAELSDYRKKQLELQEKSMQGAAEDRQLAREERRLAEERRQRGQDMQADKDVYGVIKDFEKDDVTKALKKQQVSFGEADGLLEAMEQGNEIALGALGTKMARAMGEVGVLTDTDVKRYIEAQSLVQKAKDKFGRNFMGQLSSKTVSDLKDITKKMGEGFKTRRDEVKEKYVDYAYNNFGKDRGFSRDEIETRFGFKAKPKETEQPTPQEGSTWEDDQYIYRMNNGKIQRKKK